MVCDAVTMADCFVRMELTCDYRLHDTLIESPSVSTVIGIPSYTAGVNPSLIGDWAPFVLGDMNDSRIREAVDSGLVQTMDEWIEELCGTYTGQIDNNNAGSEIGRAHV